MSVLGIPSERVNATPVLGKVMRKLGWSSPVNQKGQGTEQGKGYFKPVLKPAALGAEALLVHPFRNQ